jgi:sodium ion-translocating decarboxylase beta subunit
VPIGFGALLSNIPVRRHRRSPDGMIGMIYSVGVETGIFPLLIFMGVGALTDFGALIANPSTLLLGAAAQFGIFATLIGAVALNFLPGFDFTLAGCLGHRHHRRRRRPDGDLPASILAPDLLGAIAVAAYSYMALVPLIQPPIMRALTTKSGARHRDAAAARGESRRERILFPFDAADPVVALLLPDRGAADRHAHLRQPDARMRRGRAPEPPRRRTS